MKESKGAWTNVHSLYKGTTETRLWRENPNRRSSSRYRVTLVMLTVHTASMILFQHRASIASMMMSPQSGLQVTPSSLETKVHNSIDVERVALRTDPESVDSSTTPSQHSKPSRLPPKRNSTSAALKDPCLIIYHIPKSGGLSLGKHIKRIVEALDWEWFQWYTWFDNQTFFELPTDPPPGTYNHLQAHVGHLTPQFEQLTNTSRCYKMTLLREPVDRVISAFYYHHHATNEWDNCLIGNSCKYSHEYQNDVVRRFAARGSAWTTYDGANYDTWHGLNDQDLEIAKQSLETMDRVCFLDNLRDCVESMAREMKVRVQLRDEFVNKNDDRLNNLDDHVLNKIAAANRLDIELYEWARAQFGLAPGKGSRT